MSFEVGQSRAAPSLGDIHANAPIPLKPTGG